MSLHAIEVVDKGKLIDEADTRICSGYSGRITVYTGVIVKEKIAIDEEGVPEWREFSDAISIGFSRENAIKCVWVQFAWVEIIVTQKIDGERSDMTSTRKDK